MKKGLILGLTLAATFVFAAAPAFAEEDRNASTEVEQVGEAPGADVIAFEETPSHIFLTRDEYQRSLFREPLARRTPNMTYHGGKIMTGVVSKAIFWGTSWGSYTGDKITGLDSWYTGFSNSNYAKTTTEYTGSNGTVGTGATHQGHIVDTSAASGGGNTTAIINEVCKQVTAGNIIPDPAATATTPSTRTSRAATRGTARGTVPAAAEVRRSSSRSSGSSTATPAATRATPPGSTRRASRRSRTSRATSWPRR